MERVAPIQSLSTAPPRLGEIWRRPLEGMAGDPVARLVCRVGATGARRQIVAARGLHRIEPDRGPFVLAFNHSQRLEAFLVPALLILHRRGHRIHFFADWPMTLVPMVKTIYRAGGVILVHGKRPRMKLLRWVTPPPRGRAAAFAEARGRLDGGAPVGVFVEGTTNRDPRRLLRGQTGAARLAIQAGVPVIPAGIRYPDRTDQPIRDRDRMVVEIGEPIEAPPRREGAYGAFHERIMREISALCGKRWRADAARRKHA